MAAGRQTCEATEDVVVFGRMPLVLSGGLAEKAARQMAAIRAGLDALLKFRNFPVDK